MSTAEYVDRARAWGRSLEDREAMRIGDTVKAARLRVARETGIPAGTLENLRNGRLKAIAVHVYDRLRHAVERQLTEEMRRLEHELDIVRQTNPDPRDCDYQAVMADLAKVRATLGVRAR